MDDLCPLPIDLVVDVLHFGPVELVAHRVRENWYLIEP